MNKKRILQTAAVMAAAGAIAFGTYAGAAETIGNPSTGRVCVHDPSIFKTEDGQYYVFGSHTAIAKSDDLIEWKQVNFDYSKGLNVPFYGTLTDTFEQPFTWAGYNDGDCLGGYAIWAPDIIWNPYYEWDDGTTGAYMMYTSESSTWRRSCISLIVSKDFEGPYTWKDTVVYSGFTMKESTDGNSSRDTKWDNDYLELKELTELGSENGGFDEVSDTWFMNGTEWNHNYAPNAIDPTIFFDRTGEKLYMVYGSWSGGIYLLEMDKTTGKPIYPGVDSVDEASGNYVDRYFGTHLAGGNHESGEGPYIVYDPETDYYYLYETYGGLAAAGGYNMRLFRSKEVTGPYLDARGGNAAESGNGNNAYGIKLMGNYAFADQVGKRAAGHNSAFVDDDGNRYLIYHQRFDMIPPSEGHEVRVHQQFLNEDNWPVTAVYEYCGEEPSNVEDSAVVGSYEFIDHGTDTTGDMIPTSLVTLTEDGSVEGTISGTWTKTDSQKGYDYLTIVTDGGVTYKGYFYAQHKEDKEQTPAMTFTAIGDNNECIWGSMADLEDDATVLKLAAATLNNMIPGVVNDDLDLVTELFGAEVVWTSENADLMDVDGIYHAPEEQEKLVLHATITKGEEQAVCDFKMRARPAAVEVLSYDFENEPAGAEFIGTAQIVSDEERGGNVLKIENEPGAQGVNYLKLPEDLFANIGKFGYTVSMWVKIGEKTFEHSALFEADAKGNYPMTRIEANLIARINANGYSDVLEGMLKTTGERSAWQHVAYTVSPEGIQVYLNGVLIGREEKDISECFKKKAGGIYDAVDVAIGSGHIWGDEDCQELLVDDVRIYNGVISTGIAREIASK